MKNFKEAVVLAPDEAVFWANLGGAYGMTGEYEKSIDALKKGIDISPSLVNLKINIAVSYINLKEYQNAILALEKIPEEERLKSNEILRLLEIAHNGLDVRDN